MKGMRCSNINIALKQMWFGPLNIYPLIHSTPRTHSNSICSIREAIMPAWCAAVRPCDSKFPMNFFFPAPDCAYASRVSSTRLNTSRWPASEPFSRNIIRPSVVMLSEWRIQRTIHGRRRMEEDVSEARWRPQQPVYHQAGGRRII